MCFLFDLTHYYQLHDKYSIEIIQWHISDIVITP